MKHIFINKIWIMAGVSVFLIPIMIHISSDLEKKEGVKREIVHYKIFSEGQKIESEDSKRFNIKSDLKESHSILFQPSFSDFSFREEGDFEKWAVFYLQSHFRRQVVERTNFAFLLSFQGGLKKRFPENWKEKRSAIIREAFPESAGMIEELYDKLSEYDAWFKRNRNLMATMNQDEIKGMIWQRRMEIFGETAGKIWDIDSKVQHFNDIVSIFQNASHISLEEKLGVFRSLWDEMRVEEGEDLSAEMYKYHLAFLDMESVQSELRQLGNRKRHEELALIRETMGYDQNQIEESARSDAYDDEQWSKGRQYMRRRDEIVGKYIGADRENRLRSLREHYFKGEANRIAAEEAINFFRFKQKRVFGRN